VQATVSISWDASLPDDVLESIVDEQTAAGVASVESRKTIADALTDTAVAARTLAIAPTNAAKFRGAKAIGIITSKRWVATNDDRTRPTHREDDGPTVPIDANFGVGRATGGYPGDPQLPLDKLVNCPCTVVFDSHDLPESANIAQVTEATP
jgi:hypothetical protein